MWYQAFLEYRWATRPGLSCVLQTHWISGDSLPSSSRFWKQSLKLILWSPSWSIELHCHFQISPFFHGRLVDIHWTFFFQNNSKNCLNFDAAKDYASMCSRNVWTPVLRHACILRTHAWVQTAIPDRLHCLAANSRNHRMWNSWIRILLNPLCTGSPCRCRFCLYHWSRPFYSSLSSISYS